MMALVAVDNPIVKNHPADAIAAMADAIAGMPKQFIKAAIDDIIREPGASWPTAADMIERIERKQRASKEKITAPTTHASRKAKAQAVIDRAMRSESGQKALALGIGRAYMIGIERGNVDPEMPISVNWVDRQRARLMDRRSTARKLTSVDDGQKKRLSGRLAMSLVSLSQAMDRYETFLRKKYQKKR